MLLRVNVKRWRRCLWCEGVREEEGHNVIQDAADQHLITFCVDQEFLFFGGLTGKMKGKSTPRRRRNGRKTETQSNGQQKFRQSCVLLLLLVGLV